MKFKGEVDYQFNHIHINGDNQPELNFSILLSIIFFTLTSTFIFSLQNSNTIKDIELVTVTVIMNMIWWYKSLIKMFPTENTTRQNIQYYIR